MRIGSRGYDDASRNEGLQGGSINRITLASGYIKASVMKFMIVRDGGVG